MCRTINRRKETNMQIDIDMRIYNCPFRLDVGFEDSVKIDKYVYIYNYSIGSKMFFLLMVPAHCVKRVIGEHIEAFEA